MTLSFKKIDKYGTCGERIGGGTYGDVYIYSKKGIDHAVKVQKNDECIFSNGCLREIVIMRLLAGASNIISMIDVCMSSDNTYIVMPLGIGDLSKHISTLSLDEKVCICYQVCMGVKFYMDHKVIHQDLKPQNIILFKEGEKLTAKITDFGLSIINSCENLISPSDTNKVYTLWYRSPEILLGEKYGFKADIWALGCIIGEIFAESALFPGNDDTDQLFKIFRILGTPSSDLWPNIINLQKWKDFKAPSWTQSKWDAYFPKITDNLLIDLLNKILIFDQNKRVSIDTIIKDPFFDKHNILQVSSQINKEPLGVSNISDIDRSLLFGRLRLISRGLGLSTKVYASACYIFDAYTSKVNIDITFAQGYGIACLMLSSMVHGNSYIYLTDLSDLTVFTEEDIGDFMKSVCMLLDFQLIIDTWENAIRIYKNQSRASVKLSKRLCVYMHACKNFALYSPSDIALVCMSIACKINDEKFACDDLRVMDIINILPKFIIENEHLYSNFIDYSRIVDILKIEKLFKNTFIKN
jgi:serine/threonine protein kinase